MKMKKILAMVLAVLVAASVALVFSSCNKRDEEEKKLVIGVTYLKPMCCFDENGELAGFDVELAAAVCEKLGMTPEFVELDRSTAEAQLTGGTVDCILGGVTTAYSSDAIAFSTPYMENKQVLIVRAENLNALSSVDGLAGAEICAEEGSAGEVVVTTDEVFAGSVYTGVVTQTMALDEVAAGTSDGCVVDCVTSVAMLGKDTDYADLEVVDAFEFGLEYYVAAFRREDSETLDMFNDAIAVLMADGSVDEIAERYSLSDRLVK